MTLKVMISNAKFAIPQFLIAQSIVEHATGARTDSITIADG